MDIDLEARQGCGVALLDDDLGVRPLDSCRLGQGEASVYKAVDKGHQRRVCQGVNELVQPVKDHALVAVQDRHWRAGCVDDGRLGRLGPIFALSDGYLPQGPQRRDEGEEGLRVAVPPQAHLDFGDDLHEAAVEVDLRGAVRADVNDERHRHARRGRAGQVLLAHDAPRGLHVQRDVGLVGDIARIQRVVEQVALEEEPKDAVRTPRTEAEAQTSVLELFRRRKVKLRRGRGVHQGPRRTREVRRLRLCGVHRGRHDSESEVPRAHLRETEGEVCGHEIVGLGQRQSNRQAHRGEVVVQIGVRGRGDVVLDGGRHQTLQLALEDGDEEVDQAREDGALHLELAQREHHIMDREVQARPAGRRHADLHEAEQQRAEVEVHPAGGRQRVVPIRAIDAVVEGRRNGEVLNVNTYALLLAE
mmetsp:Transcript_88771/g.248419  ORF Transcript_88771/g.248419 Transcript_88771/m.248419 type:complete len:417 (+) Transcript_88771:164-1414(+)